MSWLNSGGAKRTGSDQITSSQASFLTATPRVPDSALMTPSQTLTNRMIPAYTQTSPKKILPVDAPDPDTPKNQASGFSSTNADPGWIAPTITSAEATNPRTAGLTRNLDPAMSSVTGAWT